MTASIKFIQGDTGLSSVSGLAVQGMDQGPSRLSVALEDENGLEWTWSGDVQIDDGQISVPRAQDPMAWLWDLTPSGGFEQALDAATKGADRGTLAPKVAPLSSSTYQLTLGDLCISVEAERMPKHVACKPLREGRLRGLVFKPDPAVNRGVVVLGGSEGGISADRAAALAGAGFVTLALGYFGYDDRPGAAYDLPLEYFSEAMRWLRDYVNGPIGLWGASRGSEAAILSAAAFKNDVDAVIAWAPSHLVNSGFDMASGRDFSSETAAMWSLKGHSIPGVPFPDLNPALQEERTRGYQTPPGYVYSSEYMEAWLQPSIESDYALPIDQVRAPVLIVAPEQDALWPSAYSAERLIARNPSCQLITLPGAGHAIGMPNEPRPYSDTALWQGGYAGLDHAFVCMGGKPAANARGARDAWQRVLQFLDSELR